MSKASAVYLGITSCGLCLVLAQPALASPIVTEDGALMPAPPSLAISTTSQWATSDLSPSWESSIPTGSPDLILLLRSGLTSDDDLPAPSSPGEIQTQRDLAGYAQAQMRADSRIEDLSLSSNSVALTYLVPGRLFGAVAVMVPLREEIDSDGSVSLQYPWYALFVSLNTHTIATALKATASTVFASESASEVGKQISLSAAEQGELLLGMYEAVHDGGPANPIPSGQVLASAQ